MRGQCGRKGGGERHRPRSQPAAALDAKPRPRCCLCHRRTGCRCHNFLAEAFWPGAAANLGHAMAVIEAEGISKRWGSTLALDGASFTIEPGVTGLLGA